MIDFECPHCRAPLSVQDQYAGRTGKCRQCQNLVVAPLVTPAPAAASGPSHLGYIATPNELPERHFIAFDFETTGLSPFADRIVEFGAVKFDRAGNILATYQEMANPGRPISPEAEAVHGITDAQVRDSRPLDEVTASFLAFLGPSTNLLFAHNALFDARFLAHELARQAYPFAKHAIVDSMDIARRLIHLRSYKLGVVSQALGIRQPGAHRALADALMVMGIVGEFIRRNKKEDPFTLIESSLRPFSLADVGIEPLDLAEEFAELQDAMREGRETAVTYWGGAFPGQKRSVVPKGAFIYRSKRYLSALCVESNSLKTYCLDLIGDNSPDEPFMENPNSDAADQTAHKKSASIQEGAVRMDWTIDITSDTPVFKQIKNIIRRAVQSGELAPDDQLPSVREIAERCGVNANTAARALRELQLQGFVYSRRGSGVFVADPSKVAEAEELIADLEPDDAETPDMSCQPEDAAFVSEPSPYDATGHACARVFSLLDEARLQAQAAGLDWDAIVHLFNKSG